MRGTFRLGAVLLAAVAAAGCGDTNPEAPTAPSNVIVSDGDGPPAKPSPAEKAKGPLE